MKYLSFQVVIYIYYNLIILIYEAFLQKWVLMKVDSTNSLILTAICYTNLTVKWRKKYRNQTVNFLKELSGNSVC